MEDNMSLKQVFDKVHPYIPTQKEIEPLIEYDRDRKKLDVFLSLHKKTLTIADIKVYMPFTINLDPYLRKVIKEEVHNMEEYGLSLFSKPSKDQEVYRSHEQSHAQNKAMLTRRQAVELSKKMSDIGVNNPNLLTPSLTPGQRHITIFLTLLKDVVEIGYYLFRGDRMNREGGGASFCATIAQFT